MNRPLDSYSDLISPYSSYKESNRAEPNQEFPIKQKQSEKCKLCKVQSSRSKPKHFKLKLNQAEAGRYISNDNPINNATKHYQKQNQSQSNTLQPEKSQPEKNEKSHLGNKSIDNKNGGISMSNDTEISDLADEAEQRLKALRKTEKVLERQLEKCPEGKIHIVRRGNNVQYYLRKNPAEKSGKYLRQDNKDTIKRYIQKSYNENVLKVMDREITALDQFLNAYQGYPNQIRKIYTTVPDPIKKYISPVDMSDVEFAKQWIEAPFTPKPIDDMKAQGSPYITDRGECVRSKSEIAIANALNKNHIPYKYECPLELNGVTIYPDFTVLNVRKRVVFYWEHRGMMDDRDYAKHTVQRLKDYKQAGIFPGKTLIITEETATNPLSTQEILDTIRAYLL